MDKNSVWHGLRRECFSSIGEVNGINVNFPLLVLFFVDIQQPTRASALASSICCCQKCSSFGAGLCWGEQWQGVQCLPLLPALSLCRATYGCCLRPPEVGFETFLLLAHKHVCSESKYTLTDFQATAHRGGSVLCTEIIRNTGKYEI